MELGNIQQINFSDITTVKFDILIMVSGYENRCSFLAEKLQSNALTKIVFGFKEKKETGNRPENDKLFRHLNYEYIEASGNSGDNIQTTLEEIIGKTDKKELNILVDYSCMTKDWYSTIVNYFVNWDFNIKLLHLYFSYTPSQYEKSHQKSLFKLKTGLKPAPYPKTDNRPVALVLGLGYDQDKAMELVNRIRPAVTYAFYSNPSQDERFVTEVRKINSSLLKNLPANHIFRFPMNDFRKINILLKELVLDLRLDTQVILAPLGPKPFALNCMLLSARYPDVWVWRVHTDKKELYHKWLPMGDPLICRADFLTEDISWEEPE